MSIGATIRVFLHDLFKSRLAEQLQDQILLTRSDYEHRLQEKDRILSDYKSELEMARNKLSQYELILIPLVSPVGKQLGNILNPSPKPDFAIPADPSSWEQQQKDWYASQLAEAEAEANQKSQAADTMH